MPTAIARGATSRVAGPGTKLEGQTDNSSAPPPTFEKGTSAPSVLPRSHAMPII